MIVEQMSSGLIQILGGFDEPSDIFHGFFDNRGKFFRLIRQLFFSIFAGKNRKQGQKLFLMVDGQRKQIGQGSNISEMSVALLPGNSAVFVVDDVEQGGGVLLNLRSDVVVGVEDDDEGVLVEIFTFESDGFPPELELLEKTLYLLFFLGFQNELKDLWTELVNFIL